VKFVLTTSVIVSSAKMGSNTKMDNVFREMAHLTETTHLKAVLEKVVWFVIKMTLAIVWPVDLGNLKLREKMGSCVPHVCLIIVTNAQLHLKNVLSVKMASNLQSKDVFRDLVLLSIWSQLVVLSVLFQAA